MFANIIYVGSGASYIIIGLLDPPKHYPRWNATFWRKYKFLVSAVSTYLD
jgi:hypothetical protein